MQKEHAKAIIAEMVAEITALVEEIKAIDPEEVEAAVAAKIAEIQAKAELQIAKLGHKHYEKAADSYYVAIGGDTVAGTGINADNGEKRYVELIGEAYG